MKKMTELIGEEFAAMTTAEQTACAAEVEAGLHPGEATYFCERCGSGTAQVAVVDERFLCAGCAPDSFVNH